MKKKYKCYHTWHQNNIAVKKEHNNESFHATLKVINLACVYFALLFSCKNIQENYLVHTILIYKQRQTYNNEIVQVLTCDTQFWYEYSNTQSIILCTIHQRWMSLLKVIWYRYILRHSFVLRKYILYCIPGFEVWNTLLHLHVHAGS